jgi:electron transport complex protein RnfG
MTVPSAVPAAAAPVPEPGTPAWRLLATLGGAGALSGLLLVLAWRWTTPIVTAHRAGVEAAAVAEVLRAPARLDTLYLDGERLTRTPPAAGTHGERAYIAYDAGGARTGVAVRAEAPGFVDAVAVMIGFDPERATLLGMKILAQKETPGLGDKIEKDSTFVRQFAGRRAPLQPVKSVTPGEEGQVVTITGATISSRVVVRIINEAIARWQPLLAAYTQEPGT